MVEQYPYSIGPPTLYEYLLESVLDHGLAVLEIAGVTMEVDFRGI